MQQAGQQVPSKIVINIDNGTTQIFMIYPDKSEPAQPIGQPLPDAGLTQAEYERVVKGVKLSDPVDAEISRSCKADITCLSSDPQDRYLLIFGCTSRHLHGVGIDAYKKVATLRNELPGR